MGRSRYSDSDDDWKYKKKKKRSRSRSHSSESSYSSKHSKSKKSKKSKHKKRKSRSRSRDRSRSRYGRRSYSRSPSRTKDRYDRYESRRGRRSRDRHYSSSRSRSRERSRSRDRRYRSRSRSRDRRYRSRSRDRSRSITRERYRSRSRSRDRRYKSRSRSRSASRRSSRRSSPERGRKDQENEQRDVKNEPDDPTASIPGFDRLPPLKQNEIRMQLALRAADAANEKLKAQGVLAGAAGSSASTSVTDQLNRAKAIEDIENDGFRPVSFKTGVNNKPKQSKSNNGSNGVAADTSHELAMFGTGNAPVDLDTMIRKRIESDALLADILYEDMETKMKRWVNKLTMMRKQNLEGEAMS